MAKSSSAALPTVAFLAAACLLPAALALSSPLCESGGQAWVTKRPFRNPAYPGADLYCELLHALSCTPWSVRLQGCFINPGCCMGPPRQSLLGQAGSMPTCMGCRLVQRTLSLAVMPTVLCQADHYLASAATVVCDAGLNVLGDSVDPCLNQGSLCTQAATDAICKFIGEFL
jgi:hypothetical protein